MSHAGPIDTPEGPHIAYQPTAGMSYDPTEEKYWDPAALQGEITRAFEICHGCRMCFKYCDSFPLLFKFVDEATGDVRKLTAEQTDQVVDACFQCKLCEVQCPYTPADNHEFQLDFPKLLHRYTAQRAQKEGLSLGEKLLADPDGTAKLARMSLGVANAMNRVKLHRWFMEKLLGIHRDKLLPDFAGTTFEKWASREGKLAEAPGHEAVLFQTCYVQNNEPQIGRDTLEVMEKNQVDVKCVKGLACCGMPRWEKGDYEQLKIQARQNLDLLMPHVEAGSKVLVVNPTCSMMMRREYPEMLAGDDRERAKKLAAAVRMPASSSGRSASRSASTPTSRAAPARRSPTTPPATCAPSGWASRAGIC
jgi:glycerol-3-phosphate dehydrogenase subunit C